jgi:TetR/AcrR family transcriptional repressor of nem operon
MVGRPKEFEREEVLGKALDVFWAQGYDATSLDDLTGAMGIGRASLYNEFGDKHSLFVTALDRYRFERRAEFLRVLEESDSVRTALATIFETRVNGLWADETRRGCLLVNTTTELASSDPDVAARAVESFDRTAGYIRSALERGKKSGELTADLDVPTTANYLANALTSLPLLAKVTRSRKVAQDVVEVTLKALD